MKEDENEAIYDSKSSETDIAKILDDFSTNHENGTADSPRIEDQSRLWEQSQASPDHKERRTTSPFMDDYDTFTAKIVLECDLPVFEVCYKEDSTVKDICVDMKISEEEKKLINGQRSNNPFLKPERCDLATECNNNNNTNNNTDLGETYDIKSVHGATSKSQSNEKAPKRRDLLLDLVEMIEENSDEAVSESSNTESVVRSDLSIKEFITQPHDQISQSSNTSTNESARPEEDVIVNNGNMSLYNRQLETESITFNFKSSETISRYHSTDQENVLTDGTEQDNNARDEPAVIITEDSKSDNPLERWSPESSRKSTSDDHRYDNIGETGFSGPVPFPGSVSHRSDGSTTSGKSFAFPVLQSEWNSSPVRMVKADKARLRKHKGWRLRLFCCKF